jgi:hypothetical protein
MTDQPYAVTLDSDTTKPSTSAPGHGPADTLDPYEIASSSRPQPGPEARTRGTVNAVTKVGRRDEPRTEWLPSDRIEREQVRDPDGRTVTVERNLELGVTRTVEASA